MRLSAVVVTQNEEKNIERCLRSLAFADEIVVVDAHSEDRTVELATGLGARVIVRKWDGFASQKQFAIDQARGEWIFLVDSDEEATVELAGEIREVVGRDSSADGYRIRRRNQFLGGWMDYGPWADDSQTRLFLKERGRVARRPVHEGVQIDGALLTLQSPLNHYTHQTLSESVTRLNRYTSLEATERVGRRRVHLLESVIPPFGVFVRYYVTGGCWKAGMRGFLLSATTAMYKSVLYLKIYLLQKNRNANPPS